MATSLENKLRAILTEKENKILPENIKSGVQIFDIEGTLTEGGGEGTEDATATTDDVLNPKTFYAQGKKQTGAIGIESKVLSSNMYFSELSENTSYYIYDICERHKLVLLSAAPISSSTTFYIGTYDDIGNISIIYTKTFTGTTTYKKINDMKFSKVDNVSGYVNIFVDTNGGWTGNTYFQMIGQFDPKTNSMVTFDEYQRSRTGGDCSTISIVPHPTEDGTYILCCCRSVNAPDGLMLVKYNASARTCYEYSYIVIGASARTRGSGQWNKTGTKFLWLSKSGYNSTQYAIYSYPLNGSSLTTTKAVTSKTTSRNLCWFTDDWLLYGNSIIDISGNTIKTIYNLEDNINGSAYNLNNDGAIVIFNNNSTILVSVNFDDGVVDKRIYSTGYTDWYTGDNYKNSMTLYKPSVNNDTLWYWSNSKLIKVYLDGEKVISSFTRKGVSYYATNDSTAIASNILINKTAYNTSGKISGTMPNQTSRVFNPSTNTQMIPEGYYNGNIINPVTSDIDINIVAENIRKGILILGVEGTFEGLTGGDATSDGNLQAKYLLEGYSAVVDGKLIQGTMKTYGTKTIIATSEDITIPEGHYDSLSIPIINAANCKDYTECSQALTSI